MGSKQKQALELLPAASVGAGGRPRVALRPILRSGMFAGRAVEYRSKEGDILLTGSITSSGGIACDCKGYVGPRETE